MTPYRGDELDGEWEFKIVRSATNVFGKPAELQRILEEESRAGWVMLEKFDNGRIRLKRRAGRHTTAATADFDPYRTWVGPTQDQHAARIAFGIFGVVVVILGILLLVVR